MLTSCGQYLLMVRFIIVPLRLSWLPSSAVLGDIVGMKGRAVERLALRFYTAGFTTAMSLAPMAMPRSINCE